MKKFLIFFFVLLIILTIGVSVFLATLDVDRFRPQIISRIEKTIQKPVRLERIKIGWQAGIALELQGFALLKSEQTPEKLVEIQSVKAVLKLEPLLSREIQVETVYLDHPIVLLVKKPDGTFDGWEPAPSQPGQSGGQAVSAPKAAAALSFLVNKIKIQDGELFFKDDSGKEPVEVNLRKIAVEIDQVALDRPIEFNARAAVLGPVQNLDLKGKLTLSEKDFSALLSGFHAELQLKDMNPREVTKLSPAIAASGIVFPAEGILGVDADSLRLGAKDAAAKIRFDRGKIRLQSFKSPIENISVSALASAAMIKIQKITADLAGGKVEGQGAVNMTDPQNPAIAFDVKANKLLLGDLFLVPQDGPQIKGLLSLTIRGNSTGQASDEIIGMLTAEGDATLDQGVITNMNILREVFQKISVIPGLMERLLARLPEDYKSRLDEKDTKLKTIQLPFSVQSGTVDLPRVSLATDSFRLEGSGTYGLDHGTVTGMSLLSIDKNLSAAMIRSVEELQYLTDSKGELQIPLSFRGNVPEVTITPDLQSVATKIAAQKAKELIGGYLEKALGKNGISQDAGLLSGASGSASGTTQPKKRVLEELLRQAVSGTRTE